MFLKFIFVMAALMITSCATESSKIDRQTAATSAEENFCARQHIGKTPQGDTVTICDQMNPQRPYIQVPAPKKTGELTSFYGAISPGFLYSYPPILQVADANGVVYTVINKSGKPLEDFKGLPANLKLPNNRYLYTVFSIQGKVSRAKGENQILISSMTPALVISGCAIDSLFLGRWSGTAYARTATGFDSDPKKRVKFTFTLDQMAANERGITSWDGQKQEPDGEVWSLRGHVDKMRDLKTNPFSGATDDVIELFRVTTMHIPGDNHIGINYPAGTKGISPTGMGSLRVMTPENLIRQTELTTEDWKTTELRPHAPGIVHGSSPLILNIYPVQIGTQVEKSCQ